MDNLLRLSLAIATSALFFGCSREAGRSSSKLKSAALTCDVAAFSDHMTQATRTAVESAQAEMDAVRRAVDDVFLLAQRRFGDKVTRGPHAIRFEIDSRDPRWDKIFGPQWAAVKGAASPHYFSINAGFYWKEECDLIRRFEACLSDSSLCAEEEVPGSVIQMSKALGTWHLEYRERPERKVEKERFIRFLRSSIKAAGDFLVAQANQGNDEDVLVELATRYFAQMNALMREMASQPIPTP